MDENQVKQLKKKYNFNGFSEILNRNKQKLKMQSSKNNNKAKWNILFYSS